MWYRHCSGRRSKRRTSRLCGRSSQAECGERGRREECFSESKIKDSGLQIFGAFGNQLQWPPVTLSCTVQYRWVAVTCFPTVTQDIPKQSAVSLAMDRSRLEHRMTSRGGIACRAKYRPERAATVSMKAALDLIRATHTSSRSRPRASLRNPLQRSCEQYKTEESGRHPRRLERSIVRQTVRGQGRLRHEAIRTTWGKFQSSFMRENHKVSAQSKSLGKRQRATIVIARPTVEARDIYPLTLSRYEPLPQLISVSNRRLVASGLKIPPTLGLLRGVLADTPLMIRPCMDVDVDCTNPEARLL